MIICVFTYSSLFQSYFNLVSSSKTCSTH